MTYSRDSTQFLLDILGSIDDIEEFIKGIGFNEFSGDKENNICRDEIPGNHWRSSKDIPDTLKNEYSEVPWKFMAGIRDKVVHGYFVVDLPIIWSTVKKDVPSIKEPIEHILEEIKNR